MKNEYFAADSLIFVTKRLLKHTCQESSLSQKSPIFRHFDQESEDSKTFKFFYAITFLKLLEIRTTASKIRLFDTLLYKKFSKKGGYSYLSIIQ